MPLAPVIAASLNAGLPARTKALWIDGLDVLKNTAVGYGVPIESIELVEAAPGGVSSLSFTIEDPTGAITVPDAAFVRFYDVTRDLPLFAGFVESVEPVAMGIGRTITVTCVGIEILLDWWYVPATTVDATTFAPTGFQQLVASAYRTGSVPVGSGGQVFGFVETSTTTYPITTHFSSGGATWISPAGTLRQAIQAMVDYYYGYGTIYPTWTCPFTVDFRGYLRISDSNTSSAAGPLYTTIGWNVAEFTKTLTLPASGTPSGTAASVDSSGAVRAVWVTGSGAGTGIVTDGTGKPGQVAAISDANSTTADKRAGVGAAYIARQGISIAGSVTVEGTLTVGSVGAENRASMLLYLTDPNLGVVANPAAITEIAKTFNANGTEDWTISFGAIVKASQYVRNLTRSQLA